MFMKKDPLHIPSPIFFTPAFGREGFANAAAGVVVLRLLVFFQRHENFYVFFGFWGQGDWLRWDTMSSRLEAAKTTNQSL